MKKTLRLYLANATGKHALLTIAEPKDNLQATDIAALEAKLVNAGTILVADEALTGIPKAQYIETSVTDIK